ncbi:MAG: extracellular solute-binding protein [Acidimicrobiia bacterium]|nr:extracellular solute-binding protein [Acidimicrobiia bacterium]
MTVSRLVIPALVASMIAASACTSSDESTVTIYSGRTENLIQPILDDFTEETGIEVSVKYDESSNLALLIEEEGDQTPADVFLSQSPGAVDFLDSAGRLAELPDNVLDLVSQSVRDAEGRWVGFSGRQRVLVYNQNTVPAEELPSSVFELSDPRWSGRIGIAPANGSFQDFVTAMRGTVGDDRTLDWLTSLADNDVLTYPKNSAIVAAVGRGEIDVGLVNHYYNYRALDEDPNHPGRNHQFAVDDPGNILIVTGAAVIDRSDNSGNAVELIEFLLQEDAQRYFADETFEYPLASGVPPARDLPPAEFSAVGGLDLTSVSDGLGGTSKLIAEAGLQG